MKLSVIIITKNNQNVIEDCLESVKRAGEIIVVDDLSTDKTLVIAKKYKVNIFSHRLTSFPKQREWAATKATKDWFIFLDADERLTKDGFRELKALLTDTKHAAFRFKRLNYFSGRLIKNGGFWPDYQTRLFKRSHFQGIKGATHEQYLFNGSLGTLKEPVPHFPDRSIKLGLYKSALWTPTEAEALFKDHHPPITSLRLIKVMASEFINRYLVKKGFLDGYIGFVESLTQAMNKFFIYQQVWELQHKKEIQKRYQKLRQKFL
jgi:glycosyltransferase involved in cell wall biosynthesis